VGQHDAGRLGSRTAWAAGPRCGPTTTGWRTRKRATCC
jgi:hypothetical protein